MNSIKTTSKNDLENYKESIINSLPMYYIEINENGEVLKINNIFLETIGFDFTEIIGKNMFHVLSENSKIESNKEILDKIKNKNSSIELMEINTKSDEKIIIEWHVSKIINESKENYFVLFGVNVTDSNSECEYLKTKINQTDLLTNNLHSIFDNSNDLFWGVDSEFRLKIFNKKFKEFIKEDQNLDITNNLNINKIFDENIISECRNFVNTKEQKNKIIKECFNLTKDKYFNISITPLYKNNKLLLISFLANDISDFKNKQIELEQNKSTYEYILNLIPQMVFWKDINSVYLGCNKSFLKYTGINSFDEVIGKTDYDLPWEKYSLKYIEDDKDVMLNKKDKLKMVEKVLIENNELIWAETSKVPMYNSNNEVIGVLGILDNITEKVNYEEKIILLNKTLEESVENRTLELKKAIKDLELEISKKNKLEKELIEAREFAEKANEYKSQFIANISHEIRTPINAIIGINHLFESTKLSNDQREYLKKSNISAKNLMNIVNNVLDLSKIEANKLELDITQFNLNTLFSDLSEMFSIRALTKNLRIEFKIDEKIPKVIFGDYIKLNQVLINIISNSIKFTSEGIIKCEALLVSKNSNKAKIRIIIKDTGIGMTEKQIEKIFIPFEQGDYTINRKFGGTGLGLAICKQIVDIMEGEISVSSNIDEGSKFIIELDFLYSDIEVENEDIKINNNLNEISGKRVLLVEDNEINQFVITELLNKINISCEICNNGIEALVKLQNFEYDLILLDIYMPKMNGFETAHKIRELQNKVPILVITADTLNDIDQRLKAYDMDEYITKPIEPNILYNSIYSLLIKEKKERNTKNKSKHSKIKYEDGISRVGGDAKLFCELLNIFLEKYQNSIEDIKKLLLEKKYEEAIRFTHNLKGSIANIGAYEIAEMFSKLHEIIKEDYNESIEYLESIKIEFEYLTIEIENFINKNS